MATGHNLRKRRGQTLAEFSLTLPILLLLVFGTIEFGRIFQAWVTVQNSARETTRYLTTGQYDEDRYGPLGDAANPNTILACQNGNDLRGGPPVGVKLTVDSPTVELYGVQDPVTGVWMPSGPEALYATWYDGMDCEESDEDIQRNRDIFRLASAMDVARVGAAGLSLEDNWLEPTSAGIMEMMTNQWTVPAPRSNQRGYFNVSICSSRVFNNPNSVPLVPNTNTRFVTVFDESDVAGLVHPHTGVPVDPMAFDYDIPFCMLNEVQPLDSGATDNAGLQWLDPGGPGDRVTVFVTFNHPLITPLGLADYVTMTARRSGVNESFRASRALQAVVGAPPGAPVGSTNTPVPPSSTPPATDTPPPTSTVTATETSTATQTPLPFDCANLQISALEFFGTRVYMTIENPNEQATELSYVNLRWMTPDTVPGMFLAAQQMTIQGGSSETLWSGERNVSPFDSRVDFSGPETAEFLAANRTIPGSGAVGIWEGAFLNAGFNIADVLEPWNFHGTSFGFLNPSDGTTCEVTYNNEPPLPEDEEEPPEDATATFTPDCASSSISIQFLEFQDFGVVRLRVFNNRYEPAPLLGFEINWPDPATHWPTDQTGVITFRKISVGGRNADDFGSIGSEGLLLWRGREDWGDGGSLGDRRPSSTHNEGSYWRGDYVFPPRSQTDVWLDFDGIPGTLPEANIYASALNGSRFDIDCFSSPGGSGGSGGGGEDGSIFLSTVEPPEPTNTPRPSNTPGPTPTPSPTRPSPTPSNTWTPGPTRTPSFTPTPTNTEVPGRATSVDNGDGGCGETDC